MGRRDTIEDRSHRSHELNPRKHPEGPGQYPNPSKKKPWTRLGKSAAMMGPAERMFIHDVPRLLGEGDYANLGHARGGSAILMASCLQEYNLSGKIYSVDINFDRHDCPELISKFEVTDRIELCLGATNEWAERLNREFNFVFIDADHSYEAVKTDIANWAPKVKVGGMLSLHDTHQDFSHKAVAATLVTYENWVEREDLHIQSIRTFERVA